MINHQLMEKQRAARIARDEQVARERAETENAPNFWDNIDTSGGVDACHRWTGKRKRNHTADAEAHCKSYEHGEFDEDGCKSRIHTRILCFKYFGVEPPVDRDVTPVCGDHLCSNIRHLVITPKGGHSGRKLNEGVFAEDFFRCEEVKVA